MRIIHFSDIHRWDLAFNSDLFYPKRWIGGLNLRLRRRKKFPPELGEAVVSRILEDEADLVVFSGDFTTQSSPHEFRRCSELFAPLQEKWGERFFVIPGNHDRYTPRSVRKRYYERWFPYGAYEKGALPFRSLELDGVAVVGFDNSRPYMVRSNGRFAERMDMPLRTELQRHHDAGRALILVGHFPYALPPGVKESWDHRLLGADRLERIVYDWKPALYLHGHKHVRWVLRPPGTPHTVCVDAGSAGMLSSDPAKQAGYVVIETGPDGAFVSATPQVLQADGSFASEGMIEALE